MRLIDKDVLLAEVRKKFYTPSSIKLIEKQEEVKAIPIGRIKKYYEDITMPYTDTRIQFEEMIRKWEKENASISRE